jgi:hypothetical protein
MSYLTRKKLTVKQEKDLIHRTIEQITNRRLSRPEGFRNSEEARKITDHVEKPRMWLMHAEYVARAFNGWTHVKRPVRVSYLCGHEDGQDWAVRVPGTITTVEKALHWVTPAAVRKAILNGKPVWRQGDIFFVPMRLKTSDLSALEETNHIFYGTKVFSEEGVSYLGDIRIAHQQHPEVTLSYKYKWRAIQQKQLSTDGYRRGGD